MPTSSRVCWSCTRPTFEPRWFVAAHELTETMLAHFQAPGRGFYDTSDDHEALITRPRDLQDNATPSGNAMAVTAQLKLAGLSNENRYVDLAHEALTQIQPMMAQYPLGFGMLSDARPAQLIIGRPTICLAAGADLTLMTPCSVLNQEKSRRFPARRSPGQLQLGLARPCPSKTQTFSEPRKPLAA